MIDISNFDDYKNFWGAKKEMTKLIKMLQENNEDIWPTVVELESSVKSLGKEILENKKEFRKNERIIIKHKAIKKRGDKETWSQWASRLLRGAEEHPELAIALKKKESIENEIDSLEISLKQKQTLLDNAPSFFKLKEELAGMRQVIFVSVDVQWNTWKFFVGVSSQADILEDDLQSFIPIKIINYDSETTGISDEGYKRVTRMKNGVYVPDEDYIIKDIEIGIVDNSIIAFPLQIVGEIELKYFQVSQKDLIDHELDPKERTLNDIFNLPIDIDFKSYSEKIPELFSGIASSIDSVIYLINKKQVSVGLRYSTSTPTDVDDNYETLLMYSGEYYSSERDIKRIIENVQKNETFKRIEELLSDGFFKKDFANGILLSESVVHYGEDDGVVLFGVDIGKLASWIYPLKAPSIGFEYTPFVVLESIIGNSVTQRVENVKLKHGISEKDFISDIDLIYSNEIRQSIDIDSIRWTVDDDYDDYDDTDDNNGVEHLFSERPKISTAGEYVLYTVHIYERFPITLSMPSGRKRTAWLSKTDTLGDLIRDENIIVETNKKIVATVFYSGKKRPAFFENNENVLYDIRAISIRIKKIDALEPEVSPLSVFPDISDYHKSLIEKKFRREDRAMVDYVNGLKLSYQKRDPLTYARLEGKIDWDAVETQILLDLFINQSNRN